MCGGCYVPPFLIPLIYLIDLPRRLKEFAKDVDDKIRNNNQKIKEHVQSKRYEHTKCNEKELELNKAIEGTNDGNERKDLLFKRAIVRIEAERYENALEDLLTIKEVFEDNHIFHYVLGKALEGKGEYKEAANSMLNAIEKMELLSEDECLELENDLVQTQLETKHTIERGLIKAFGALGKLKSSIRKHEKPKTSINLELLYMNAGVKIIENVCYSITKYNYKKMSTTNKPNTKFKPPITRNNTKIAEQTKEGYSTEKTNDSESESELNVLEELMIEIIEAKEEITIKESQLAKVKKKLKEKQNIIDNLINIVNTLNSN
ncbi:hypothetical protein ABK040_013695 [Willaertia magna]